MTPDDQITVLIPTSPIGEHPSTEIIEQAVTSLRDHLPDAPVVLMCDGVPPSAARLAGAYAEYLDRVEALSDDWGDVTVTRFRDHRHQAAMTRTALRDVQTPYVLFWEHDWVFRPDRSVPWADLCGVLEGDGDVVRLSWEHAIEPAHASLYDPHVTHVGGVPLVRSMMWSQRPHLARTDYYRRLLKTAGPSRTMIEDLMAGVVSHIWREHPETAWTDHRLWLYHPDGGDISIVDHLDGRKGAPVVESIYAYDGIPPPGAPRATHLR